jgi:hypothetical protein
MSSKAGKGNKTISAIVPEDVYSKLKDWADSKDWSVSQAVKNLIIQGLDDQTDSSPKK